MGRKKEGVYLHPLSDQRVVDLGGEVHCIPGDSSVFKVKINQKKVQNKFAGMKLKLVSLRPALGVRYKAKKVP